MELVNGYVCHNCTDVAFAKKGVDPAHPKDGPNGINRPDASKPAERGPAVVLSGQASEMAAVTPAARAEPVAYTPGSTVDVSA